MSGALYIVYIGAALFGIMIAEAAYMLYAGKQDRRAAINRRVKLQEKKISQEQVLIQLRKERGMEGRSFLSMDSLKKLRVQSGVTMPMTRFLAFTSGAALGIVSVAVFYGLPLLFAVALFPVLCAILPVQVLKFRRNQRHKLFGVQLPEALELITRSLKAGHPVPVAIGMVAREMPDPIGTEFGVVADEVTYGSDLVDDDPRARQAEAQGAGDLHRRPHVGLHPDRGALSARRRHHGVDAAFLYQRHRQADDLVSARRVRRLADAGQCDDVQDVQLQVLTWKS
jgi:Flp pilus assembly protein TadB